MIITGGSKGQEGAGFWKRPLSNEGWERKLNFLNGNCLTHIGYLHSSQKLPDYQDKFGVMEPPSTPEVSNTCGFCCSYPLTKTELRPF